MSVLTLDVGGTALTLPYSAASQNEPLEIGERTRAFAGGERSSVRAQLFQVRVATVPILASEFAAIRALFALAAQVPCAGDCFDNGGATVVCSGKLSGEMLQGGLWWIGTLTLTQTTAPAYTPPTTQFLLTGVVDSGSVYVSTPAASYPGDVGRSFTTLSAATPATCMVAAGVTACAITYSSAPERSWLSVPLTAGQLGGKAKVLLLSTSPAADRYPINSTLAKLYLVRGGADVAGPFLTEYEAGYFAGGTITLTTLDTLSLTVQAGDRVRCELWSRIALGPGYSDTGLRQTILHGARIVPGDGLMILPGALAAL